MTRQCENWLQTLAELVKETESPPHFWLWSGLFTLTAALERRVWVPYGLTDIYPNMFVVFVAPPGRCRKAAPIVLSKKMLSAIQGSLSVDSTSPQGLVNDLAGRARHCGKGDEITAQSPMSVISKEFSSLFKVDLKNMVELLTDIFDTPDHDVWIYKVLGREQDKVYGPCLGLLAASTPSWVADNIPYQSFGSGFFSRVAFVTAEKKLQRISWPELSEQKVQLYRMLVHDLNEIFQLWGPMRTDEDAKDLFKSWYDALDKKYDLHPDERYHGFIERSHIYVLKVAMALHVAYEDSLIITFDDMSRAIAIVEDIYPGLDVVFRAMGRNPTRMDSEAVVRQLASQGKIKYSKLLADHWNNIGSDGLYSIVLQLLRMKYIKTERIDGEDFYILWKGAPK